jgi:two-component system, response regulator RegA
MEEEMPMLESEAGTLDEIVAPRAIVAEDGEPLRRAYERILGREYRTIAVATVDEAITRSEVGGIAIAIVDLRLGNEDGLRLVTALRQRGDDMRIIVVSGYLTVERTVMAVQAGADAVVPKPIAPRELLALIKTASSTQCAGAGETSTTTSEGNPEAGEAWETPSLDRAMWEHIHRVLADCGGNISRAARRLGLHRQSLQRKLRRYAPSR